MWNFIQDQNDLEVLMKSYKGFYNSKLSEIHYVVEDNNHIDKKADHISLVATFVKEEQLETLEDRTVLLLKFDDVKEVYIKPNMINTRGILTGASILVEDGYYVWFDNDNFDEDYELLYSMQEVTRIKARKMMWKINNSM